MITDDKTQWSNTIKDKNDAKVQRLLDERVIGPRITNTYSDWKKMNNNDEKEKLQGQSLRIICNISKNTLLIKNVS